MKPITYDFTAANGIPFRVRVILKGDAYGLNNKLTCGDKPLVAFYDLRYMHTEYGQFVSRYYLETLLKDKRLAELGLCLDGGVRDWNVDAGNMRALLAFLAGVYAVTGNENPAGLLRQLKSIIDQTDPEYCAEHELDELSGADVVQVLCEDMEKRVNAYLGEETPA
jgi:hypothetical protein